VPTPAAPAPVVDVTTTNTTTTAALPFNDTTMEMAWRNVVGKTNADYSPNGATAQRIASVTPYFPFKGIPRFYDIGGVLKDPEAFQLAIDVFVERYRDQNIDSIVGFDARGFVLGPPIALALKKPFVMLRKKGKMPNAITGSEYSKEYAGNDSLSIPRGSINKGDRVLLIDDLVATGGTLVAGIELVKGMGGVPVEAACVVELKFLDARKKFKDNNHDDVPIWALMDEEILTLDGLADPSIPSEGYVDDGDSH
jgi:adenine phosphoribosyltransferase